MASGWFDNLRRMLGWWSAAPSSGPTPANWIGVDTATLRLSRGTATHRTTQATARLNTTNATATQRPV